MTRRFPSLAALAVFCGLFATTRASLLSLGPTCDCVFVRGDANDDGNINLSDAVLILNYLCCGSSVCNLDSSDTDDNGAIQQADAVSLLCWLFGTGTCGDPPPPPQPPFPLEGCDCTPDDLEPCCSRPNNSPDPESLTIAAVDECTSTGNTWDSPPNCFSPDQSTVRISASNNASCAHANSSAFWDITFAITDPHGVDSTAIENSCVSVKTSQRFRASYLLGDPCFSYQCPPWLYNELALRPPLYSQDYQFTFVDPNNPSISMILGESSGTVPIDILEQYAYDDYCFLEPVFEVDQGDGTSVLAATGFTFGCWTLKYFTIRHVQLAFNTRGNPDLATTEAIGPGSIDNYSLRLLNVKYDWCDG